MDSAATTTSVPEVVVPRTASPTPGSPSRARGSPVRTAVAAPEATLYALTPMIDGADGYAAQDIFTSTSRMAFTWDDLLLLPGKSIRVFLYS